MDGALCAAAWILGRQAEPLRCGDDRAVVHQAAADALGAEGLPVVRGEHLLAEFTPQGCDGG